MNTEDNRWMQAETTVERERAGAVTQDQRDIEREAASFDAPYAYEITYGNHDCELVYAAWLDKYASGEEEADILWRKPLYARHAPEALPVAAKRLIGWRTSDYLMETSDPEKAKNWQTHYDMLPIFEGDPHTKLAAPEALGAAGVFNEDAERAAFEDMIRSITDPKNHHDDLVRDEYAYGPYGDYARWPTQMAWEAWKARAILAKSKGGQS